MNTNISMQKSWVEEVMGTCHAHAHTRTHTQLTRESVQVSDLYSTYNTVLHTCLWKATVYNLWCVLLCILCVCSVCLYVFSPTWSVSCPVFPTGVPYRCSLPLFLVTVPHKEPCTKARLSTRHWRTSDQRPRLFQTNWLGCTGGPQDQTTLYSPTGE